MGALVNLRRYAKAKARAGAEAEAAANRAAFGRTKAEKMLTKAEQDLEKSRLDAHKRDPDETP